MINLTIAGTAYAYPQPGDPAPWGSGATSWAQAVSQYCLQTSGGSFPLTSNLNLGSNFGIVAVYLISGSANPAQSGVLRLANTDAIAFRNSTNTADLLLKPDADGILQYNSIDLVNLSAAQTLTNKTLSGAANTFSNIPTSSLSGSIANSQLAAMANNTVKGNTSGASASPSDLSLGNVTLPSIFSATGTASAVIGAGLAISLAAQAANLVFAGPASGSSTPTFRALVGADLPLPTLTTLGGVQAASAPANEFQTGISTAGQPTFAQPAFSNLSGTAQISQGGTGQTTASAAFNALSPITTTGDIIVGTGTNQAGRLGAGSASQVLQIVNGAPTWASIQEGAKNYITFNNFENNATTGWSLAHSALSGTTPTSVATAGQAFSATSGGSAANSNLSIQIASSGGQIAGNYSGEIYNSTGASTAGDMFISQAYTIDREDQAKVLSFQFYYTVETGAGLINMSGTSSNSFAVWIYDVTNAAWIQPAGVYNLTQIAGVGICSGSFQTPANLSQFQLAIVNINSVAGAYGLIVDDFSVSPVAQGPTKVGNPQRTVLTSGSGTYTTPVGTAYLTVKMVGGGGGGGANGTSGSPTGGGNGGNTTFGTSLLVANGGGGATVSNGSGGGTPGSGGTSSIASTVTGLAVQGASGSGGSNEVSLVMSGGTGGASPFGGAGGGGMGGFPGYSAAANSGSGGGGAGSGSTWSSSGGGGAGGYVEAIITAPLAASYSYAVGAGGAGGSVGGGNGFAGGYGGSGVIEVTAHFGTGGLVDAQGDGRVVAFKANSASTSVPSGTSTQVIFTSVEKDSTGSYSSSTGNFTAPKSGFYNFESSVTFTTGTTSDLTLFLYKNGAVYGQMAQNGDGGSGGVAGNISSVWMNAGDYVSIYVLQSSGAAMTVSSSSTYTWFSGHMVSGNVIPQAGQSVNARYHSATVSNFSAGLVTYTTKDFDTNNAYSGNTYTIPISGKYQVNASLVASTSSPTSGQVLQLGINKNGSNYTLENAYAGSSSWGAVQASVSDILQCNAGDTITIYVNSNLTSVAVSASSTSNYLSITRIGD